MSYRIAIASTDGKVINQHFGKADNFLIVEVNDKKFEFIENRKCEPICKEYEHDENALNMVAELLKDCRAVFVSKIGKGAAIILNEQGIRTFESPYFIEDVLKRIVSKKGIDLEKLL